MGTLMFQPCTRTNSRVRTAYTLRSPSVGRECPDTADKEPCSLNLNCFNYFYNITGNDALTCSGQDQRRHNDFTVNVLSLDEAGLWAAFIWVSDGTYLRFNKITSMKTCFVSGALEPRDVNESQNANLSQVWNLWGMSPNQVSSLQCPI